MILYILAAGQSTRFSSPKILKSYPLNFKLFSEYFDQIIIVTVAQLYDELKILEQYIGTKILVLDGIQTGSGDSLWNLNMLICKNTNSIEYCLAWSDAIYNQENITSIIHSTETTMAVSYVNEAYVNIHIVNGYAVDYTKGGEGFQDCSIFKIFTSYFKDISKQNDFMDYIRIKPMKILENKHLSLYFNTLEEYSKILETYIKV